MHHAAAWLHPLLLLGHSPRTVLHHAVVAPLHHCTAVERVSCCQAALLPGLWHRGACHSSSSIGTSRLLPGRGPLLGPAVLSVSPVLRVQHSNWHPAPCPPPSPTVTYESRLRYHIPTAVSPFSAGFAPGSLLSVYCHHQFYNPLYQMTFFFLS